MVFTTFEFNTDRLCVQKNKKVTKAKFIVSIGMVAHALWVLIEGGDTNMTPQTATKAKSNYASPSSHHACQSIPLERKAGRKDYYATKHHHSR